MTEENVNTSQLVSNDTNQEVLEERVKYWTQELKTATDSRLQELVGRTAEGTKTREELEEIAAKRFVIEEERIKSSIDDDNPTSRLAGAHLLFEWLPGLIKKLSWEEKQAERKKEYEHVMEVFGYPRCNHKHKCWHCGREFYSTSSKSRYCCYRCTNDAYIKRRKERKEKIRRHRICLYCNKEFSAKRAHTKYCSESHRVLACHIRKQGGKLNGEEDAKCMNEALASGFVLIRDKALAFGFAGATET
jgi:hypothetical protein